LRTDKIENTTRWQLIS